VGEEPAAADRARVTHAWVGHETGLSAPSREIIISWQNGRPKLQLKPTPMGIPRPPPR